MELFIIARFHAHDGRQDGVVAALRDVVVPTRAEPGCLAIEAFRAINDPRLFYIHSRWVNEAVFENRAGLPHTAQFIECVPTLIDHPLEVVRVRPIGTGHVA